MMRAIILVIAMTLLAGTAAAQTAGAPAAKAPEGAVTASLGVATSTNVNNTNVSRAPKRPVPAPTQIKRTLTKETLPPAAPPRTVAKSGTAAEVASAGKVSAAKVSAEDETAGATGEAAPTTPESPAASATPKAPEPAAAAADPFGQMGQPSPGLFDTVLRPLGATLMVCALAIGGLVLYRRYGQRAGAGDEPMASVMATLPLGDKRNLTVVKVGREVLVLGNTAQSITLLAQLGEEATLPGLKAQPVAPPAPARTGSVPALQPIEEFSRHLKRELESKAQAQRATPSFDPARQALLSVGTSRKAGVN